ncbi:MAG: hypothetical protein JNL70_13925 [Saprospiraceae bacterium]|nr:hypothetical protein [Saprospiraceae bacterium]
MEKKLPKTVLTARIESELKEQLSVEAAQYEMNLSNYTEYCLRQFNAVLQERQLGEERNYNLQEQIYNLQEQIGGLISEVQGNRDENLRLLENTNALIEENERLQQQLLWYKKQVELLNTQANEWALEHKQLTNEILGLEEGVEQVGKLYEEEYKKSLHLNEENMRLKNELNNLKAKKKALSNDHDQCCKERDALKNKLQNRLPIVMNRDQIGKVKEILNDLKTHHSYSSEPELLVWALATAARNEKRTFIMYNLNDFKKYNPDFFTSNQFQI